MTRVQDKVAIVTGGASGIGRAAALLLAREGAHVMITDILDAEGESLAREIEGTGGRASFMHHDVSVETEWIDVIEDTVAHHDKLDVLVNNAGIAYLGPITEMTLEDFRRQNAVNLDGTFLGMKHAIPAMSKGTGASIINLSSIAGLKGSPNLAAYSMTKGGVRLLTKSVARECIDMGYDIRVNSVHPGIINTDIWDKMVQGRSEVQGRDIAAVAATAVPGGVLGTPEDIARGILFLASDESSYMTGSELVIDHGYSA